MAIRIMRAASLILAGLSFLAPAQAAEQPLTFGVLQATAEDAARELALQWLKSVRPVDDVTQTAFDCV